LPKKCDSRLGRKEREREQHRQEFLRAAERVFVRKGFHEATVEEIAQEAEFAVGTLYNFFKGKEELYDRIFENLIREFTSELDEKVFSEPDPRTAIVKLIETMFNEFEEHRAFARVVFDFSPQNRVSMDRAMPKDCLDLRDRHIEKVTAIFEKGIRLGQFDEMDPLYLALSLDGIIHSFFSYWLRTEPKEPLPVRIAKLTNAFMSRICLTCKDHREVSSEKKRS
jgi:AcrR family transcriptional regulator